MRRGIAAVAAACVVVVAALLSGPVLADDESDLEAFLQDKSLPRIVDAQSEPKVEPVRDEDGLYRQSWSGSSFLDLREDLTEATRAGKRLVVVFEQKGCLYCKKFHTEILAEKYINDYIHDNFVLVQINLWGDREVTDFDGKVMPEKQLASRWQVVNTPTAFFMPETLAGQEGRTGREIAVYPQFFPGAFGPHTTLDTFTWVRIKGYESGINFQRFHIRRLKERGLG
jgi:thioredoxin-related protein